MRYFFVYILTNNSGTLYTGVTGGLECRLSYHQAGVGSRFTSRYDIGKLLYYEIFGDIHEAIAREKRIKGWTRAKKIALFEAHNPGWLDISDARFSVEPCDADNIFPEGNDAGI